MPRPPTLSRVLVVAGALALAPTAQAAPAKPAKPAKAEAKPADPPAAAPAPPATSKPATAKPTGKSTGAPPAAAKPAGEAVADPFAAAQPNNAALTGQAGGNARESEIYGDRLDGIEGEVAALKDKIFRSKARLAVLRDTVMSGVMAGGRVIVAHRNR